MSKHAIKCVLVIASVVVIITFQPLHAKENDPNITKNISDVNLSKQVNKLGQELEILKRDIHNKYTYDNYFYERTIDSVDKIVKSVVLQSELDIP